MLYSTVPMDNNTILYMGEKKSVKGLDLILSVLSTIQKEKKRAITVSSIFFLVMGASLMAQW